MKKLILCLAASIAAAATRADVVDTADGAHLVGKLLGISGGVVTLDTAYAGKLAIKQSLVTAIHTDAPVSVRLKSGATAEGVVAPAAVPAAAGAAPAGPAPLAPSLAIATAQGPVTTTMPDVAAEWPQGAVDPAVVAAEHHWEYEITANLDGTSGNKTSLDTGAGIKAEDVGPSTDLKLYAAYDRAVTEGVMSSDFLKAGVDYTDNFTPLSSWFARDEGGFDRVMDERFTDVAAAGYGFDVVKTTEDVLTARIGLAYLYDDYYDPANPRVSAPAGDIEIDHDYKNPTWGEVSNTLALEPTLTRPFDLTASQDSYYQVPLKNPRLKLRVGLTNNYNSRPGPGFERLDTLYYAHLVFDWGYVPPAP